MKCDEAKPACARCTTTGRKCDGYAATINPFQRQIVRSAESPSKALTFNIAYDALEQRSFEFFRLRTSQCMAGHFQDAVWQRIVLQACQVEPAVRYAVNAVGAFHEERCLRESAFHDGIEVNLVQTNFPARQYSKALTGLQRLLSSENASTNMVLLCALLLIHFESLRERFIPVLTHLDNALRLLDPAQAPSKETIDPSLVQTFVRLDLQSSFFIDVRVPSLTFITSAIDNELPNSFADINQARRFSISWTSRLFKFLRAKADKYKFVSPGFIPLEDLAEAQHLEQMFTSIERLLWSFMQNSNAKLTFREHHGLSMLRVLAIEDRVIAACCLYSEASCYDQYIPEFEQIVSICRFVLDAEDPANRLMSVAVDDGLLRPLWFVVTHCRDSRVRRNALALLKQLPASSSAWHVDAMTKAAELCMTIEETGCTKERPQCEDIPEWRRIHGSGFDAWILAAPSRREVMARLRTRPNGMDGEWMDLEVPLEW